MGFQGMRTQWLIFAVGCLVLLGCSAQTDDQGPQGDTGTVSVRFQMSFNGQVLNSGFQGVDEQGVVLRVQHLGLYIGGLELLQNGAVAYATPPEDVRLLTTANPIADVSWNNVPLGSYSGLRFWVGVPDSVTNLRPPNSFAGAHPLFVQQPFMHWDTQRGYIFLRLDANTDVNQDGIPDAQVRYQIGTRPLLRRIDAYALTPITVRMVPDAPILSSIVLDSLLVGVQPRTNTVTFSQNFDSLALRLANNIPRMFR